MLEQLPEEENNTENQNKKAELVKTKNNLKDFLKNKITQSNFNKKVSSNNNDNNNNNTTTKTSLTSRDNYENNNNCNNYNNNNNININNNNNLIKLSSTDINKQNKLIKKPCSSKQLIKLSNKSNKAKEQILTNESKDKNETSKDNLDIIPLCFNINNSKNIMDFPIEENIIKSKKRSNSNNNNNKMQENSRYSSDEDDNILEKDEEDDEDEYSYEEENVHEININDNEANDDEVLAVEGDTIKEDRVSTNENELNNINQRSSKMSQDNEIIKRELSTEIDKWKLKGEENKLKIIQIIGEDNFNQILSFYIEKTNVLLL